MHHIIRSITLFLFLVFFIGAASPDRNVQKDALLMQLVYNSLNANHYQPKDVNDDFAEEVFKLYLKRLDYTKRFLLKEDYEILKSASANIDEEFRNGTFEFFDLSVNLINKRIAEAKPLFEDALKKPFDFKKSENLELDGEKRNYAENRKALKELWFLSMKYETMVRLNSKIETEEKKDSTAAPDLKAFEADARDKVLKNTSSWFERLERQERDDWMSLYLNSLANVYDPHTGYFPPKDKEDFDIQMSGQLEGIGARLSEKDGYIEVVDVVPGSASWRQGELEVGDLILEVGEKDEDLTDLVGMRVDHAVKYIRGPKGTEVRLNIKKKDGLIKTIAITREVVQLEQTYARSAVIQDKKSEQKAGFIYLPKFYANFNSSDGRRCSEDVAKEVEKLKEENVDGIIIDLRNNGGGSLQDVIEIAGLFIKSGPIVQVKDRYRPAMILRDTDTTLLYDGPLVIMTNFFSASASEILAAAIQDYDRGLVLGSASTFGKGTVQSFIDLDNFVRRQANSNMLEQLTPLGSVKMTFQKFYRIDGRSTQLRGVVPDVITPDSYELIDLGEKEQDYALTWDEITETPYQVAYPEALLDKMSIARQRSQQRINTNETFQLIHENAKRLLKQREQTIMPLNLEAYHALQERRKEESESFTNISAEVEAMSIEAIIEDKAQMKTDTVFSAKREKWFGQLKKDLAIYEAINVIEDINSL